MTDNQSEEQPNIEKLQQDLNTVSNNWKRALADFENYKKQKEKENRELVEFAREVAVVKLLPTLDALEQALKHLPNYTASSAQDTDFEKKYQNWQVGINGILVQMDKILGELGVEKIEAVGKKFDPHFHEAVKETESEQEDGIVISELQSGFVLNGRVIRPSQVIISKKATEGGE